MAAVWEGLPPCNCADRPVARPHRARLPPWTSMPRRHPAAARRGNDASAACDGSGQGCETSTESSPILARAPLCCAVGRSMALVAVGDGLRPAQRHRENALPVPCSNRLHGGSMNRVTHRRLRAGLLATLLPLGLALFLPATLGYGVVTLRG